MTAKNAVDQFYICNPEVVLREEDTDGGLLFNPDTNQVRILNETGLFIWHRCDGKHTISSIVEVLREAYDDVPADIGSQVTAFVESLFADGLLGVVHS